MQQEARYWFAAKKVGWGWGLPSAWQGWLVMAAYLALMLGGGVAFEPKRQPMAFAAYAIVMTLAFIAICWIKGEPPGWRWGRRPD